MHDTKNDVRSACHCLSGWCWIQGDAPRISKKQIISIRIHRESMKGAVTDKSQPRHKKYTQFYREEGVFFGIIYV